MRAKEFIVEYMNYTPVHVQPDYQTTPIQSAVDRVGFLLDKGEARDPDHALKIAANEIACELEMDPVDARNRLKKLLKDA